MTNHSESDCLKTAIDKLDATETDDLGTYEYLDDATGKYYLSDESDLVELGRMILDGVSDAYSIWCSNTTALVSE